jgi:thiol-disulfide isomerase/thioredoxin
MLASRRTAVFGGVTLACIGVVALADEKAKKAVAVAVGQPAPVFEARTMAGRDIKFPESYKGKIVLVDFWATWCPPCRREIPHLREAYTKFHDRGFEILGVTLDGPPPRKISAEKVSDFTTKNEMKWDQIYDNVSPIAKLYSVRSIPSAFLMKGDTGEVLALGDELRGEALAFTLEKHLPAQPPAAAAGDSEAAPDDGGATDEPTPKQKDGE